MPFSVYQTNGICDILPCQNTVRPNCASRFFYTDEERESFCRLKGDPPLRAQVCPKRGVSPRGGPWLGSFFCPFRGGVPPSGGGWSLRCQPRGPPWSGDQKGPKRGQNGKKGVSRPGGTLGGAPFRGGSPPLWGGPSEESRRPRFGYSSLFASWGPPLEGGSIRG